MVALAQAHPDLDEFKARLDCRDVYQAEVGTGKRSGKALIDRVPWREDHKPSLTVYVDGWKDWATGESGSVIDLIMRLHTNLNFQQAIEYLGMVDRDPAQRRTVSRTAIPISKPQQSPEAWRSAAQDAVAAAEHHLWSGRADANRALNYLRSDRGFTDDTIRRYRLGFTPVWTKTGCQITDEHGTIKNARLAPGIVIPWLIAGEVQAVKVRCIVGGLAKALERPPEQLRDVESPKYLALAGGSTGELFNADTLRPGAPVIFVEGEFDAILGSQIADMRAVFVTLGSASNVLSPTWRDRLATFPMLLAAMDTDEAGQKATSRLQEALGSRLELLAVPEGKDLTDYAMTGGDVMQWITGALSMARSEDGIRHCALYCGYDPALITYEFVRWAIRTGELQPDSSGKIKFCKSDLIDISNRLNLGFSKDMFHRGLTRGDLGADCFIAESDSSIPSDSPVSELYDSALFQSGSGKKAVYYCLRPIEEIRSALSHALPYKALEKHFPAGEARLPKLSDALLAALLSSLDLPESSVPDLSPIWIQACQIQDELIAARSLKAARKDLVELNRLLPKSHSTRLPPGWVDGRQYRRIFKRALHEAAPEQRVSYADHKRLFGVSHSGVGSLLKGAGLENDHKSQFEDRPITSAADIDRQVRQLSGEVQGRAFALVVKTPQGERSYDYDGQVPAQVQTQAGAGATVLAKFRVASRQKIVAEVQKPGPRLPSALPPVDYDWPAAPFVERTAAARPEKKPVPKPVRVERGFTAKWAADKLALALTLTLPPALALGPYAFRSGQVYDSTTGELLAEQPSSGDLAHLLLSRVSPSWIDLSNPDREAYELPSSRRSDHTEPPELPPDDPLLAHVVNVLHGTVTAVYPTDDWEEES